MGGPFQEAVTRVDESGHIAGQLRNVPKLPVNCLYVNSARFCGIYVGNGYANVARARANHGPGKGQG
jgi:hypothetical protein